MADRRKLQGEVERCLKKVSEGTEAFEEIWQKVQNATNLNQKEKYEAELKREIKKLQRLREQLKTWATSSDVKDKDLLRENRKLIELQMERFRVVEKETKTKAYSKEGLGQAFKIDPETKEFERCREWLNEALKNLDLQIDACESQCEALYAGSKKKKLDKDKQDRVDELAIRRDKHRYHISQLEHILRLLDNHSLEVDAVNKVREDVEYYIDNCQEPDFVDDEGIYDDLDLDTEIDLESSLKFDNDKDDDQDLDSSPSSSINSGFSGVTGSPSKLMLTSPSKNTKSSSSLNLSNGGPCSTPSKRNIFSGYFNTCSNSDVPTSQDSQPHVNGLDHMDEYNSYSKNDSFTTASLTTPLSSINTVAAVLTQSTVSDIRPSSPGNKSISSTDQSFVRPARYQTESLKYPDRGINTSNPHWRKNNSLNDVENFSETVVSTNSLHNSLSTNAIEQLMSSVANASLSFSSRQNSSTSLSSSLSQQPNDIFHSHHKMEEQQVQPTLDFNMKASSLFGTLLNQNPVLSQKAIPAEMQEVCLQPVHGVAPLGPVLLTQERIYQLKSLDASYHHLPQKQDSEKMRPYISRSAVPIANYHLHQAPPNIDSIEFFQRLSTETLFFIFYYQEGTRAQYLAAKALKKQSWRFHTKYMMWFQRHEEPKRITDEFEEGTYIFFDYEKWSQRKRDGFTFEYRYLEDKDLP
ncbi:CCR4-NOT transcription complex subunit 3 isoform X1 [Hydra vulgaris]|uniref:CCR4-NOT transcription complex subunit 3 n=1 Tax=Hydra vulgaris TaxID=6087 RepID=T2MIQ3_HYDVU|nr:CCR4-NOT transcription complex subunit 3 isoform X1 [Hydra vulgaris]